MSALSLALAAFAANPPHSSPPPSATPACLPQPRSRDPFPQSPLLRPAGGSASLTVSIGDSSESSSVCSLDTPSLASSSCLSLTQPPLPLNLSQANTRRNEHLAVLLPRNLWKPDSLASQCDTFSCPVKFSLFERRHHCRKCGGVFCANCSARTMSLLDASRLDFLHPPRNIPLSTFESPISPILPCRVCDDCWAQIHGRVPRPHEPRRSSPITVSKKPLSESSSLSSSSISTPPNGTLPLPSRIPRSNGSSSQLGVRRLNAVPLPLPDNIQILVAEDGPSLGELDAYPLRRSSALCKVTGGGRWEPKVYPSHPGYRIPGGKAPFEIEMDRVEEQERVRRSNPIVKDGDFQYRFPQTQVRAIASSPFPLSTF